MTAKIYEALNWASSFLKGNDRDENVGEILLRHRLKMTRTTLLMNNREPIPDEDLDWLRDRVVEHVKMGKPIQYMIGYEWFYGNRFKVTPDVLIPRPETEELIEGVLEWSEKHFLKKGHLAVCDIGTGSGAIAVTLAKERPEFDVTSIDISEKALEVAKSNAEALDAKVRFVHGSLLAPFKDQEVFDIVISNPPYITAAEMMTLNDVVKEHEPHLALAGGTDGLDFYRAIASELHYVMKDRLLLALEIGSEQGAAVSKLIHAAFPDRVKDFQVKKDINGHDRMIFALLGSDPQCVNALR